MIIYRCGKYFLFFHRGRIQAVCCLCRTIWSRWEFWMRRVWGASGQTCHGSSCMPQMMMRSATVFRPILWCWGTWPFKQLTLLWDTLSTHPHPSTYAAYDRHLPQLSFVSPHSSWGQHTHWCYQHMNFIVRCFCIQFLLCSGYSELFYWTYEAFEIATVVVTFGFWKNAWIYEHQQNEVNGICLTISKILFTQ